MKNAFLVGLAFILFAFCSTTSHAQKSSAIVTDTSIEQAVKSTQIQIIELSKNTAGIAVIPFSDTLFYIYSPTNLLSATERAKAVSSNIEALYHDKLFSSDSVILSSVNDTLINILYKSKVLMSVLPDDARCLEGSVYDVAQAYSSKIKEAVEHERSMTFIITLIKRILFTILSIALVASILWFIQRVYRKSIKFIDTHKTKYFKDVVVKGYTILSIAQETRIANIILGAIRWLIIVFSLYFSLPIVFSIFPYTQGWAETMFSLVWGPTKEILYEIWAYLPKLASIIVTILVMKYVTRFVKYVFREIESEKLVFKGFHADWAKPTYNIVRFLLYALTLVFIFPKLPHYDSSTFKGVSVFIGVLFSLGSTSVISNMVAGLVITYMRPFQIGDRIMIGNISGDVLEKNMLVTRVKTIKNEEITIPNSAILAGNTINYTTFSRGEGLIIHTTVTIGYDVPWKKMHACLVEAAMRTKFIENVPQPFVLQTSLDDFYVAYQINAYTKEASRQAVIKSSLHQNIQDVCRDQGIEIMSPHYRAERDGSPVTIPVKEVITPATDGAETTKLT